MIVNIVNGFLGSGKTTFIKNLLAGPAGGEQVVVLVNEFGEVGIDGLLLGETGLDVVELANGCICCTLSADLKAQVQRIAVKYSPETLFIEPSGVATIDQVLKVLNSLSLEKYVRQINVILVVDVSDFMSLWQSARLFVTAQVESAQVVFINKCDKVEARQVEAIKQSILTINQGAKVLTGTFGRPDYLLTKDNLLTDLGGEGFSGPHRHAHLPGGQYDSLALELDGTFALPKLEAFFASISQGYFGRVTRAKGIFLCAQGWKRLDYASRSVEIADFSGDAMPSRLVVIGHGLRHQELRDEINNCVMGVGEH